jgi:hypothetical protein
MKLNELQERYYGHVVSGNSLGVLSDLIRPGGRLESVHDAMRIHRNGYVARLTESLGEIFKSVWFVLGDELFFSTCACFIKDNPSSTYNLSLYGHEFPKYLKRQDLVSEFPFLVTLAEFELNFNQLFHTRQEDSLAAAEIYQKFSQNPNCKIKFCHSVKFLSFEHPVYSIWKACKEEKVDENFNWDEHECLCLYKWNEKVFVRVFEEKELTILTDLHRGVSLEETLANPNFQEIDPNTVQSLFEWLASSGIVKSMDDR